MTKLSIETKNNITAGFSATSLLAIETLVAMGISFVSNIVLGSLNIAEAVNANKPEEKVYSPNNNYFPYISQKTIY